MASIFPYPEPPKDPEENLPVPTPQEEPSPTLAEVPNEWLSANETIPAQPQDLTFPTETPEAIIPPSAEGLDFPPLTPEEPQGPVFSEAAPVADVEAAQNSSESIEAESLAQVEPASASDGPEIPPPSPAYIPPADSASQVFEVPLSPPPTQPEEAAPPPPPPPPPVAAAQQPLSPQDERTYAMLAHLSVLLNLFTGFLGPVVALIIYLAYKDRSRYVAFQSLQAFVFQLVFWVGAGVLTGIAWTISGALVAVFGIGCVLMPCALVITLLPLAAVVYGVLGAIETNSGKDFRYWWIGDLVSRS